MSADGPPDFRPLVRMPATPASLQREIDDEIRFHIDSRCEDLVRAGHSEQHAREIAEREYGDAAQSKRELIDLDRRRLGQERRQEIALSLVEDLRYAARGLKRRPALTAVVTFALTVGIAANAVMFSVVDQLLLRPPALVAAPEAVKRIYYREKHGTELGMTTVTGYPTVTALREHVPAFEQVAGFFRGSATLGRGTEAGSVDLQMVSGNYFSLLGVAPALGRPLSNRDDSPEAGVPVAVISDGLWRSEFASSRDAIGRRIELDGKPFTIVGVMPQGFTGAEQLKTDAWVPVSAVAATRFGKDWSTTHNNIWVQAIGRLRRDATEEQATAQATAAFRAVIKVAGQSWRDTLGVVSLGPINAARTPRGVSAEGKVSLWLLGVAAMVFLIACANVANLLIASMLQRRREISVRLALGVSRGRLLQSLLAEAVLLASISAAVAFVVAHWATRLVQTLLLPGLVWRRNSIDLRVLAFTAAAAIGCVLLAGLVPAMQGLRTSVSDGLKASSRQAGGDRSFLRSGLLAVQAMLSIVLLVGAGLFVTSLRNVSGRDVGIELDRVLLVRMDLRRMGFDSAQRVNAYRDAAERIRGIRGVTNVAAVGGSAPMASGAAMGFRVPGREKSPDIPGGGPYGSIVTNEFFTTTGTKLLMGRWWGAADERAPSRVMVVSELVAKSYWPNENPIGKCVHIRGDSTCTQIVGVVQNVMLFSLVNDDRATLYIPPTHPAYAGSPPGAMLVRVLPSARDGIVPLIRKQLQAISPNMPFVRVDPFRDLVADQMQPWRLGATMFMLFGAIALILAAVGLYSVLAYWVSQRTHEIGVRMALGAQRADVMRLVALKGSTPVAAGLVVGLGLALFASRFIAGMLYETSPRDARVYLTAAIVLGAAAVAASIIPALRSSAVDPVTALRAD